MTRYLPSEDMAEVKIWPLSVVETSAICCGAETSSSCRPSTDAGPVELAYTTKFIHYKLLFMNAFRE